MTADVLEWKPADPFDVILLDAPCTATGTIRRHPDVAWLKQERDVAGLAALQARMIDRAVAMLKPGGTLVYCTCSLEPEEGEAQVPAALKRLPLTLMPVAPAEIGGLAEAITPGWHGQDASLPSPPCDTASLRSRRLLRHAAKKSLNNWPRRRGASVSERPGSERMPYVCPQPSMGR